MPDAPNCCMLIKLAVLCFKILSGFKLLLWLWLIVVKRHAYSHSTLGTCKETDV
jgi:hypothetical protein